MSSLIIIQKGKDVVRGSGVVRPTSWGQNVTLMGRASGLMRRSDGRGRQPSIWGLRFDLAVTMSVFGLGSMSFLRHTKIYRSDDQFRFGGRQGMATRRPLAHRLDESPSRLFLGRLLSSRACLRFTGQRYFARTSVPLPTNYFAHQRAGSENAGPGEGLTSECSHHLRAAHLLSKQGGTQRLL
jgi:hypothetical protein